MKYRNMSRSLAILLLALAGGSVPAQNGAKSARSAGAPSIQYITPDSAQGTQDDAKRKKAWSLPAKYRNMIEQDDLLKSKPDGKPVLVESTPWLAPNGERLVGIVEQRTLTKPQLDLRVNLMLRHQPPLGDAVKEQDRRIIYESRILEDWTQLTALAVHAEKIGMKVTEAEVDKAMQDLAAQSADNEAKANEQMRMIGIPERDLRQELRDGILIEKMMRDTVSKVSDEKLRPIFKTHPDAFLTPTRVKAWQLFVPLIGSPTRSERGQIESVMAKAAKRLRKCKDQEDYLALQKELKENKDVKDVKDATIVLSYLDGVSSNEPLPPPVMKELFAMDPGDTSKVITSQLGLHAVKVIERKQGHRGTFEEAKPQIQNYLVEKLKDVIYESIKAKYEIHTSAAGLSKYKEIGKSGRAVAAEPTPAVKARANRAPSALEPKTDPSQSSLPKESVLSRVAPEAAEKIEAEESPATTPAAETPPPARTLEQDARETVLPDTEEAAPAPAAPAADPDFVPSVQPASRVSAPASSKEEEMRRRLGLSDSPTTASKRTSLRRRSSSGTRKLFSEPPPVQEAIIKRASEADVNVK